MLLKAEVIGAFTVPTLHHTILMRAVETREFFNYWIIYVIAYVAYIITYHYICRIIVDTNLDT